MTALPEHPLTEPLTLDAALATLWPTGGVRQHTLDALEQASLTVLEWPQLAEVLQRHCLSTRARQYWQNPLTYTQPEPVSQLQAIAAQLCQWLEQREIPEPGSSLRLPLAPLCPRAKQVALGATLSAEELGQLGHLLGWIVAWLRHLRLLYHRAGNPECLTTVFEPLALPETLANILAQSITADGRVLDDASPALTTLRARQQQHELLLQQTTQRLLGVYHRQLQERLATERDGRVVLPFQASHKHSAGGVVHDVSASGQTAYVEPAELLPLNNQRRQLEGDIEAEIERVCRELTAQVLAALSDLAQTEATFVFLDSQLASARLAMDLVATPITPTALTNHTPSRIALRDARHPLLALAKDQAVVANSLAMGMGAPTTLVITGPNTGGKSVLLKMVGLCAWMLRLGLLLPCQPGSQLSLFHPIAAVLGDAQDLQQNLSTFSGHIQQLAAVSQAPLSQALVLIDEIASGTDPEEGATLAEALLTHLNSHGALTLVTTHLGRLKQLAAQQEGFANASVLFDRETLTPTYQLAVGLPGASHALTIARRYGLPETICQQAEALQQQQGNASPRADALLVALGEQQQQMGKTEQALSDAELAMAEREARIQRAEAALLEKKHAFTHEVQRRIRHHLQQLEQDIAQTRQKLRHTDNEGELTQRERYAQRHNRRAKGLMRDAHTAAREEAPVLSVAELQLGQRVSHTASGMTGTITALDPRRQRLTMDCSGLPVEAPVSEIIVIVTADTTRKRRKPPKLDVLGRPLARQPDGKATKQAALSDDTDVDAALEQLRQAVPLSECHLLGQTVADALETLDIFLDEAVLANQHTVAVIHGVGTGRLKQAVRQHLKQSPLVALFTTAQAIHGGDGKTVVLLK